MDSASEYEINDEDMGPDDTPPSSQVHPRHQPRRSQPDPNYHESSSSQSIPSSQPGPSSTFSPTEGVEVDHRVSFAIECRVTSHVSHAFVAVDLSAGLEDVKSAALSALRVQDGNVIRQIPERSQIVSLTVIWARAGSLQKFPSSTIITEHNVQAVLLFLKDNAGSNIVEVQWMPLPRSRVDESTGRRGGIVPGR